MTNVFPQPYFSESSDGLFCFREKLFLILDKNFDNIYNSLKNYDRYMALADYADYCEAQRKASALYRDRETWSRMSLTNTAKSGIFAADRSIKDYAENIWHIKPVE